MRSAHILAFFLAFPAQVSSAHDWACYKPSFGAPIAADSRLCRINQLVDSWLTERGIETDPMLSTFERVRFIGSTLVVNRVIFADPAGARPSATIEISYHLNRPESEKFFKIIKLQVGYFKPLETVLQQRAQEILCETYEDDEDEFVSAGGVVQYEVTLRPSIMMAGQPDVFARVELPQSFCEAR